ncbi:uncharacterized protein N7506_010852 [Penicillium brevicompactum]|uniref:uncharacterized protein n=1 Tax=Penicillium brevicompactum TaxID=5074 RepID=UPI00253FCD67|nr:uncharacterized protein N7506_010852 [Penicillium brevicompactum]KAJ5321722.1 hypothetical protein N7506_010852 [Penicillium brevicompactum]
MCPTESQSTTREDSHTSALAPDDVPVDDVPVNKLTSFHGRLQHFLHRGSDQRTESTSSTTAAITQQSLKSEDTDTPDQAKITTSSPKRRKAVTQKTSTTISRPPRTRSTPTSSPNKRKRNTPAPLGPSASESLLRDTIPANLILLLVGVNPGIMTGITGYAYAHPSNLFWKLLHSSGITSMRHKPADTYKLPGLYSVGNTNIVERPTRDASMLSRAEMDAGVPVLEAKIATQRPGAVCLVGKSIWEAVWRVRRGRGIRKEEFRYGWQEGENMGVCEGWDGAPVFVATTTSGLAAGMKPAEKEAVWAELGGLGC